MTNSDTAPIVQQKHPIVILRERLEARAAEIKAAAPPDIAPERIIRALITSAQIDPNILACQWNSLWIAIMRCCRDGLIPDGVEAAIVPYKDKAGYIPMYRGLVRKFQQSGSFRWITAGVVREGEIFEHWIDENGEHFKHVPDSTDAPVVKTYAMATTLQGGVFISVLSMKEIDKIRKVSRATREDAPWNQWPEEMMKKTALRRLAKMLPTGRIADEDDDDDGREESSLRVAASTAPRERGAAAALDMFAGSPSETATVHHPSAAASEGEGDGAQIDDGRSAAGNSAEQSAAAAPPDPITVAYLRGKEAKAAKHERKALPGEYRSAARDAEAEAWLAGYDGKDKPHVAAP